MRTPAKHATFKNVSFGRDLLLCYSSLTCIRYLYNRVERIETVQLDVGWVSIVGPVRFRSLLSRLRLNGLATRDCQDWHLVSPTIAILLIDRKKQESWELSAARARTRLVSWSVWSARVLLAHRE